MVENVNYLYNAYQDADANIPALVNKPYDFQNFAIPQKKTAIVY